MKLSDHFSLEELIHSATAIRLCIDQTPPPVVLNRLRSTADQMELVRTLLGGKAIQVSSGYRSKALNAVISPAVKQSAHIDGYAVDFICSEYGTPQAIVKFLSEQPTVHFDQLIFEGTWVHISFAPAMRRDVLTAHFTPNGTFYSRGVA